MNGASYCHGQHSDNEWYYIGHIDHNGLACGQGIAYTADNTIYSRILYQGRFEDDKFEGTGSIYM